MAKSAVRAIRLWAYPATIIILWLVVSAFSLSQLARALPTLNPSISVQRPFQDRAPRACDDVC